MKGFDPRFKDFPDYILGITHEIWEERGVDTLNHYYAPDIVVRSPMSVSYDNQTVIDATHATLAEFPDRELLGEDVIWCGTPEEGLLSSHRILSTATHNGDGAFGKATGTKLTYRVIADCHARNNTIDDEWLIRDLGAIVRQLGETPENYAARLIASEGGHNAASRPFTPETDKPGPYQGRGNDNEWGHALANVLSKVMAGEDVITEHYDRAAHLEYPGHVTAHGWAGARDFWGGLRTVLPNATFEIHHQIGREDPTMPPRAALRWSLAGTHEGDGVFGAASGAPVYIMGMTHAEFGSFGAANVHLRREWTLFDEVAVWKQILLHKAALGGISD